MYQVLISASELEKCKYKLLGGLSLPKVIKSSVFSHIHSLWGE